MEKELSWSNRSSLRKCIYSDRIQRCKKFDCHSRGVDDESIPLALDVIVGRLFGDVETIEFKFPGNLFLSLEHHQRNLEWKYYDV